jgi:dethiobiotin synthetase
VTGAGGAVAGVGVGEGVTGLGGIVVVTGTDTGVGKTIVAAAITAAAGARGHTVAYCKPAQTGQATGEESDVMAVLRLAPVDESRVLMYYPDPLAPLTAARVAGEDPVELDEAADAATAMAAEHDLVLVEGAGGLLVPMGPGGPGGWTMADLAVRLDAPAVVVVRAGLGTLNHTALTLEALVGRGVPAHVVIGAWPAEPALVHRTNITDLTTLAGRLAGSVPEGAGRLSREAFAAGARSWLAPELHGTFQPEPARED